MTVYRTLKMTNMNANFAASFGLQFFNIFKGQAFKTANP
jgi:hypothetical protein